MAAFIGVIHKDSNSDYGVLFPDFPGCVTAGSTVEEVYAMAKEALQFHIDGLAAEGEPLPSQSMTMDQVKKSVLAKGAALFFMIEAHLPGRTVRFNASMDERLLSQIDEVADNRSQFLAQAASSYLQHGKWKSERDAASGVFRKSKVAKYVKKSDLHPNAG